MLKVIILNLLPLGLLKLIVRAFNFFQDEVGEGHYYRLHDTKLKGEKGAGVLIRKRKKEEG